MNTMLLAAGVLLVVVGVVHSLLGEWLIFSKLRSNALLPILAPAPLRRRNVRIIWATWHLASVFGWGMAFILIVFGRDAALATPLVIQPIALAAFIGGALVLVATNAKHPGWVGLWGVAVLCWLA